MLRGLVVAPEAVVINGRRIGVSPGVVWGCYALGETRHIEMEPGVCVGCQRPSVRAHRNDCGRIKQLTGTATQSVATA